MALLSMKPVALALASFLAVTYVLCILFDLVFPQWAMYRAWEILLPGFTWITLGDFFLGLAEVILYGLYVAVAFVPLYNLFARSEVGQRNPS